MNNKDFRKEITLSDGTKVLIRPITVDDANLEWNFVHNLSQDARTFRFFGATKDLSPQMLHFFTNIDYVTHMALIAVINNDGVEKEIAVARYICGNSKSVCEFAIVVDDHWQHKGLGGELLKSLIEIAKAEKLSEMSGEILPHNQKMIDFIKELGFKIFPHPEDKKLLLAKLNLAE
ncbi:MAG: GNAT family N-acetyltransferase [Bdellovibrio sp. CG12_big_fil_rev_8_21_14_0_65_39_13]|nr:MAG: GNAT family N-acetyltransferase [Bdellovibrio sp. CG22_combo_CG10-13_8_21_14_all_39_27]PIQ62178.1 MAG: GNAT family N-acetyltransferase [Bdellovibrio sp. CG12_big_fil_rev_8_21_14_0_65_39_13]PIR34189.1 MAG: GNAT family N-acetyltransferase [Bdellovibrio sp. CG11_big_fil_rev_8_21_14_0_20_39_38]